MSRSQPQEEAPSQPHSSEGGAQPPLLDMAQDLARKVSVSIENTHIASAAASISSWTLGTFKHTKQVCAEASQLLGSVMRACIKALNAAAWGW